MFKYTIKALLGAISLILLPFMCILTLVISFFMMLNMIGEFVVKCVREHKDANR